MEHGSRSHPAPAQVERPAPVCGRGGAIPEEIAEKPICSQVSGDVWARSTSGTGWP